MNKKSNFWNKNALLIAILLLGFFLRVYKASDFFSYGHDQDLASWFVRDVVVNKHLRLIGQETSTQGIFIGPLYYYLLIPFYLLFNMDPIGGVVMITIFGMFSIWSFYFVFLKVFGKKEGLIAAFIYAVSFYLVMNDRDVVPTTPVITWTVWYFYALNLLAKGKQKVGYLLLGLLLGLIWHLNFALALLIPLIPLAHYLSGKKVQTKFILSGIFVLILTSLPLILFEIRHGFSQAKALFTSLTTHQHAIISGYPKVVRTLHLFSKNADGIVWGSFDLFSYELTAIIFLAVAIFLVQKKKIKKNHAAILALWLVVYLTFFSIYSKNLSEYYLNGTVFIFVFILALAISSLFSKEKTKIFGLLSLGIFFLLNTHQFFTTPRSKSGYLYRKAVVAEIDKNAMQMDYPCIAISYITKPGYEFGYRYFFFLADMHVNKPDSGSPVYTIVFPLREDIKVDKTFGHLGLIYPDYPRYTKKEVEQSCIGENPNLTEPMWGFTN